MKKSANPNGLNIIIVGCGKVGATLTEQLINEGHDITIIDKNADEIQTISNLYDVMGIVGNGASYSVQMEAGIEKADLLIAVTDSDELNLLCCTIAKQVADCAAIARVRTPDYSAESAYLCDRLGLTMIINPEYESAKETARILYLPSALEVNSFAHGQAEIIKFKLPKDSKLNNLSIMDMGKDIKTKILVCAVEREGNVHIPDGRFVLKEGDILSFVCSHKEVKAFLDEIGIKTKMVKDCMIIGGGTGTFYLAKQLISMGINVKIIEKDRERCEELSALLPKAIIINGDGTNEELLLEEGLETIQSFVPLTGIDEQNVMLNLYARQKSNAKVITKINSMAFKSVTNQLDLGSVVYPKYITAEAIIAYVRAKTNSTSSEIVTLYHMYDQRVEAIEFSVGDNKITNKKLMDLSIIDNTLVSFVSRDGKAFIPKGNDMLLPGDTAMIVTTHTGLKDIDAILK